MKIIKFAIMAFVLAAICTSCEQHNQYDQYEITRETIDAYIINETDQLIVLYTESDSLTLPPQQQIFLANTVVEIGGVVGIQFVSWENCPFGNVPLVVNKVLYQGEIIEVQKQFSLQDTGLYRPIKIRNGQYNYVCKLTDWLIEDLIFYQP